MCDLLLRRELAVDERRELVVVDRVARLGFRKVDECRRLVVGETEVTLHGIQHRTPLRRGHAVEPHHLGQQCRGRDLQPMLVGLRVRGRRDVVVEKAADGFQHSSTVCHS